MAELCDSVFCSWAPRQAALLRQHRLDAADIGHIAGEIEALGRSEKRDAINRLAVLTAHLLKWQMQPGGRGNSWRAAIHRQPQPPRATPASERRGVAASGVDRGTRNHA